MKCWIVKSGESLPTDGKSPRIMRAGMLAQALTAAGHEVVWWTSSFDHFKKTQRVEKDSSVQLSDRYELRLTHCWPYRRNIGFARLASHAQLAFRFYRQISHEQKPDLLFAAMPTIESAAAAARYAQKHRIPFVIDIRDLWPDLFASGFPPKLRRLAGYGLIPYDAVLRYALRRATAIFAISPQYLHWACEKINRRARPSDKIFPLGYMPQAATAKGTFHPKICWFLGSFGHTYDLETVVAAAARLSRLGRSDIQFVLSGNGEKLPLIEADVRRQQLQNVILSGWLSQDQISDMMCKSYIGLACYSAMATQGIPNKVIEYLSAGLPLVSSLRGESRQLISEFACGFNYDPGDSDGLANAILRLCDNPDQWRSCHENSLTLFRKSFDASQIYPAIVRELEAVSRTDRKNAVQEALER